MTTQNPTDSEVTEELEPCPNVNCRSSKVTLSNDWANYYVYCSNCFLRGPRESTENAGSQWNALPRASVAAPQEDVVSRKEVMARLERQIRLWNNDTVTMACADMLAEIKQMATPAEKESDAETLVKKWIETLQDESHVTEEDAEDLTLRIIAFAAPSTTHAGEVSAAPVVDRALRSELIHIAAELVRGEGFLSTCAEDMNPRLKRADILKTAERQEQRLKDWAYRVRRAADKLSAAAPIAAPVGNNAEELARQIVGTVFDNTGASHETLKQVMIERITDAIVVGHISLPAERTEVEGEQDDAR